MTSVLKMSFSKQYTANYCTLFQYMQRKLTCTLHFLLQQEPEIIPSSLILNQIEFHFNFYLENIFIVVLFSMSNIHIMPWEKKGGKSTIL